MSCRVGSPTAKVTAVKPNDYYVLTLFHSSQHIPPNFFPERVTEHTYFCYRGIDISTAIIGIPEAYFDDQARGHALYVTGVDFKFNLDQFEQIFRKCGTVKKSIAVVDMDSKHTARWIVMSSFAEARNVVQTFGNRKFGSEYLYVCWAHPPGTVIGLGGRSVGNILGEQVAELFEHNPRFAGACHELENEEPPVNAEWHDNLISASVAERFEGSTAESLLTVSMDYENLNRGPPSLVVSPTQVNINKLAEAPISNGNGVQKAVDSPIPSSSTTKFNSPITPPSRPVTVVPVAPIIVATPIIPVVPAPAPLALASSWASVAAPSDSVYKDTAHLMIDLHPENKPSSTAPRVATPINPNVAAHAQGELPEEQLRVVFIFNLPSTITLQNVSDAVKEGPVLNIKFAADIDNGNRYAGIIFQYAWDAERFYDILLQEKAESRPGRFCFIVDAGRDTPYPYDDELALMDEPLYACRRLTIVKKGFFFQFSKRQLRQLCEKLVGADKVQSIWLYNGGNGTVIFSDVRSAVTVKAELDRLAAGMGKGNMLAVFADLQTTFSKDPCAAELKFHTDIDDLNAD